MGQTEEQSVYGEKPQLKRSKRHRTHRNLISDKSRVESVKEFGAYSRGVHQEYLKRFPKKDAFNPFK